MKCCSKTDCIISDVVLVGGLGASSAGGGWHSFVERPLWLGLRRYPFALAYLQRVLVDGGVVSAG